MDAPAVYEIRIAGHLTDRWAGYFAGLAIHRLPGGETLLQGPVADQAALFGLLNQIQALNLALVSVNRLPAVPSE